MSMTQHSLAYLLEHNDVPPEFVEILVNNNGAYTSSVQYDADLCNFVWPIAWLRDAEY
jgi:hypothetical protein